MRTLLVADAEDATIDLAQSVAARVGLEVVAARDGVEAIERFRAHAPRVVLLDRLLPLIDGPHACQRLVATPPGQATPVLLAGAGLDANPMAVCERYGLTQILDKPVAEADLERAILQFLPPADAFLTPPLFPVEAPPAEVASTPVSRVLLEAVLRKASGALVWSNGKAETALVLQEGQLVDVTSNLLGDAWLDWVGRDPRLLAERKDLLEHARFKPQAGFDEGVEAAPLSPDKRERMRRRRAIAIVLDTLWRGDGKTCFLAEHRSPKPFAPLDLSALLVHSLRQQDGRSFQGMLAPPMTRLCRQKEPVVDLGLTQVEQELLVLANGRHTQVELVALGRMVQTDVRPLLAGLLALGVLRAADDPPSEPPPRIGATGVHTSGDLATASLTRVLLALASGGLTGILQVRNADAQYTIHIQGGRVVFARSNQPEHRLGTVLLASGRISPEDHSRATARLAASGRARIGAILLRLRALSLKELHAGLCDQVRAIVSAALPSGTGTYTFVEGDLPGDDMVSIDATTPSLLLECLRRLDPDALARAAPAAECVALAWPKDQAQALVLQPTEQELVRAAAEAPVPLKPAAAGIQNAALRLLAIGCVKPAPLPDPAAAPAAEDVPALRRRLAQLERRLQALEAENLRLRAGLPADETVRLGG